MKQLFKLTFLLTLLLSCSASDEGPFPYKNEEGLITFCRNGDNYGKKGVAYSYNEVLRPLDLEDMVTTIESGVGLFLFLHQDNCSHCIAVHDDIVAYYVDSLVEARSVYYTSDYHATNQILYDLADIYPAFAKTFHGALYTPTIYFIKDAKTINYVSFQDQRTTKDNFYQYFRNISNINNVYNFRSYEAFASFAAKNDCLAFMDEEDYETKSRFYEEIYPIASSSPKLTAHIDTKFLEEEELAKFKEYFKNDSKAALIKKGTPEFDPSYSSLKYIKDYYS